MHYAAKIIVDENIEQYYCTILTKWRQHITGDSDFARFKKRAQNYTDFGLMAISFYIRGHSKRTYDFACFD